MNVEKLREKYPEGTRIELDDMAGESRMESGLRGTVTHVDDMGQIHMNWDNGSSLALNVTEDFFKIVEEKQLISVLVIEPGKYPKLTEIDDSLESMQEIVGGYIEEYMPFEDEVAIVCNEEGKMNGAELNRAIYGENKEILDIVTGKFFICYAPFESEKFESLPKDMAEKYENLFKYPEKFYKTPNGIEAKQYKPVSKDLER